MTICAVWLILIFLHAEGNRILKPGKLVVIVMEFELADRYVKRRSLFYIIKLTLTVKCFCAFKWPRAVFALTCAIEPLGNVNLNASQIRYNCLFFYSGIAYTANTFSNIKPVTFIIRLKRYRKRCINKWYLQISSNLARKMRRCSPVD